MIYADISKEQTITLKYITNAKKKETICFNKTLLFLHVVM